MSAQPLVEAIGDGDADARGIAASDNVPSVKGILAKFQGTPLHPSGAGTAPAATSSQPFSFGEVPAMTQLMESFTPDKGLGGPLLDLPTWLSAHVPSMDLRPRSGFYDWVGWMNENLPASQARLYLALDKHMQSEPSRKLLLRKAQWEVARLWDWQHRRAAAGLPLDMTEQELADAHAQVQAQLAAAESAAATISRQERSAAAKQEQRAQGLMGPARMAALAQAAAHRAAQDAAEARFTVVRTPSPSPGLLPDLQDAVAQAQAAAGRAAACAAAGDGPGTSAAAGDTAAAAALVARLAAVYAPSATLSTSEAGSSSGSSSSSSISSKSANPSTTGTPKLLGMMKAAEKRPEAAAAERRRKLSELGLTTEQQALLLALGSDAALGLPALITQYTRRRDRGDSAMAAAFSSRAKDMLQAEGTHRRAKQQEMQGLGDTPAGDGADLLAHALPLYQSEKVALEASKSQPAQRNIYTADKLVGSLDGRALNSQAALAARSSGAPHQPSPQQPPSSIPGQGPSSPAGGGPSAPGSAQGVHWAQLPILNPEEHLKVLRQRKRELARVVQHKAGSEASVLELDVGPTALSTAGQPGGSLYAFDLHVRPPTHTMDLVCSYMQVKYQDVLLRRDATTSVLNSMASLPPSHSQDTPLEVHHATGWASRLAPQEVATLNAEATRLFKSGDWLGYSQLLQQLVRDGLLSEQELRQLQAAARMRAASQLQPSDSLHVTSPSTSSARPAASPSGVPDPSASATSAANSGTLPSSTPTGVPQETQAALLAALQSTARPPAFAQQGSDAQLAAARAIWQSGSWQAAGPAAPTSSGSAAARSLGASPAWLAWSQGLTKTISDWAAASASSTARGSEPTPASPGSPASSLPSILGNSRTPLASTGPDAHPAGGSSGSSSSSSSSGSSSSSSSSRPAASAGADHGDAGDRARGQASAARLLQAGPPSFEEACTVWAQYVEAAGNPLGSPSLAEVLIADQQLRAGRQGLAAAAPGSGAAAARQALADAEAVASRVNAQLQHLHACWSARHPHAAASPGSAAGPGVAAGVDVMDPGPRGVMSLFQPPVTLSGLLRAHAARVQAAHQLAVPEQAAPLSQQAGSSPWEVVWGLMQALYSKHLGVPQGARTPGLTESPSAQPALQPASGASMRAGTQAAGAAPGAPGYQAYITHQDQAAAAASTQPAPHDAACADVAELAPPYPGARAIVRFTQSLVLGPASGATSAQGLDVRVARSQEVLDSHPATAGLVPPRGLLAAHPAEQRVVMRVQLQDLADEVGLSPEAQQHIVRVVGPPRFDASSGDLVFLGSRYPTREENRRWCLERLHQLLHHTLTAFARTGTADMQHKLEALVLAPAAESAHHQSRQAAVAAS